MKVPLTAVARVIRSKNAGPFELTLDILLKERNVYEHIRDSGAITAARVAARYRIPAEDILSVIHFDPACAVKVTLRRPVASGASEDTDVYGAQQHAPLLDMEVDVE